MAEIDLDHPPHVVELPIGLGRLRIGIVAVDAGLAGHLVRNGYAHDLSAVSTLRARERAVGICVEKGPRLRLKCVELAVLAIRKGKLAVEADRRVAVLERSGEVMEEGGRQRNGGVFGFVIVGGFERSALHDLVDDVVRVICTDDLEFGGGLLVGENGIVLRHAGNDARHDHPDQYDRQQDRERNRKNEPPREAAATLHQAVLKCLRRNR